MSKPRMAVLGVLALIAAACAVDAAIESDDDAGLPANATIEAEADTGVIAPMLAQPADDRGVFWTCDAANGRLLRFTDPFPASN